MGNKRAALLFAFGLAIFLVDLVMASQFESLLHPFVILFTIPLALAFGDGAEVRSPMAVTVIGGLLVSTLLTLVVIPVVYDLLDRKPDEFSAERGRRARKDAEAVARVLSHEHDPLNGGAKG